MTCIQKPDIELDNRDTPGTLRAQLQQQEILLDMAFLLGQQQDFPEMLRIVTGKMLGLFRADVAALLMINPLTQETVKTIVRESAGDDHSADAALPEKIAGWVGKHQQPFLSRDITCDRRFRKNFCKTGAVRSVLCVALICDGMATGYLLLLKYQSNGFDENDRERLAQLGAIAAPYVSNAQRVRRYFMPSASRPALLAKYRGLGLIGKSRRFIELLNAVEAATRCDVRVLLEGESGTGKELVARAIHHFSKRNEQPFVAVDCGAISEHLIESELFGHVKGAFTGAASDRPGLFAAADNGTLLMDEITNLPLEMQAKLLRVLQGGEIRPLGSNRTRQVNVRVIAACSVPLVQAVEAGDFREDLYYRLNIYPIDVPALQERREDIPTLAHYFLENFARKQGKPAEAFSRLLLAFMLHHPWRGNIRELENFIERLVTVAPADARLLDEEILPKEFRNHAARPAGMPADLSTAQSLPESLAELEKQLIEQALAASDGNKSRAARILRISEATIRYKMSRLGIDSET